MEMTNIYNQQLYIVGLPLHKCVIGVTKAFDRVCFDELYINKGIK